MVSAVAHAVTGRRHHVAALNAGYALARMVSAGSRSALTRARACSERAHARSAARTEGARYFDGCAHPVPRNATRTEPPSLAAGTGPAAPFAPWQTMADHGRPCACGNAQRTAVCADAAQQQRSDTYRADLPL
jgi:hypothetical protein